MKNLILVAFLGPRAGGESGGSDEVVARVVAQVEGPVERALGTRLTIGDEAGFGQRQLVEVNVVEPDSRLQELL